MAATDLLAAGDIHSDERPTRNPRLRGSDKQPRVACMESPGRVLRLAHADACRELSDRARSMASTYGEAHRQPGELVEEAERLIADAREVLALAVAYERQGGSGWEQIGEALGEGISRQAASKRFGERVDALELDVLLPARDVPTPGVLGWWAGPDAARDPEQTARSLDSWLDRHREPTDPGRHVERLFSDGLRPDRAVDFISASTRLSILLSRATGPFADVDLPVGVTERYARRRLLEAEVATFSLMLKEQDGSEHPHRAQTARALAEVHDELVGVLTDETRDHLSVVNIDRDQLQLYWHECAVALLVRTEDRDPETTGWFWVNPPDDEVDRGYPQLLAEVDPGDPLELVERLAIKDLAAKIASDLAKGVGPLQPGGLAGPRSADT